MLVDRIARHGILLHVPDDGGVPTYQLRVASQRSELYWELCGIWNKGV